MPTASDLVTDLPADFETFGQAVATSMADLLGGTTGQVLSKASNTDMDFSWVAQDDSNAIQNAIVDAKGDLIAATAADTPARLAVGTNNQVLTADSTAATGLKWESPYGPSFIAYSNITQSLSTATFTKISFNVETNDSDGCYNTSTYRFTPTKAGVYQIGFVQGLGSVPLRFILSIYKNGSEAVRLCDLNTAANEAGAGGSTLISMNGSSDYVEAYVFSTGTAPNTSPYTAHTFTGVWIRS